MINQIDIERFGSFDGFEWRRSIRDRGNNVENFKRLNILYGRNYSGKTTLSRVFRSMQEGALPWNHEGSEFVARGAGFEIGLANLQTHGHDIRVYNKDFVAENLSILVDHRSGQIKTFAIVGGENNRIVEELAQVKKDLGSVEEKCGARHEAFKAAEATRKARAKLAVERDAAEDKLRKHANEKIKKDRLIGQPNYNIDHIKADIDFLRSKKVVPLDEADKAAKVELLKQEALPKINSLPAFPTKLGALRAQAEPLLTRTVAPTKALHDLLADAGLQAWVKEGIRHHKGIRDSCAFCRQGLPASLWDTLSQHFSQESEALGLAVDDCLREVLAEMAIAARPPAVEASQVYVSERQSFAEAKTALSGAYATYGEDLRALEEALNQRRSSLFKAVVPPLPKFQPSGAKSAIEAMEAVIAKSNGKTSTLVTDKEEARVALRRDSVLAFIGAIDLDAKQARVAELAEKANQAGDAERLAKEGEQALDRRVGSLEAQLKDERKGAERVNQLLTHFFGHGGLRLEAVEGDAGVGVKFQITRGGKPAYHLSEGECSLIAFCYFMAQLDAPESKGKELIIYIDDPISSLDSNHVFFMFSLIETLIARAVKNDDGSNRYRYRQLFVSTHNLDFLKYLKMLSAPPPGHGGSQHFIVERHGDGPSRLSLMPAYLKAYVTEFNYLFHQIYKCSQPTPVGESEEQFYSFGNNLRKFLEAFLYFKYPAKVGSEESLSRITRFFGEDGMAANVANRLNNELSHLHENFDRSMRPIDIPEIRTLATYVLGKIKAADRHQYDALLTSIGAEPDPT